MATKKTESEQKTVAPVTEDDRVTVFIPFIEGDDPEVTVWVNDEITKIKKGHQVRVKPNVAEVLENANQQAVVAMENRKKLKNQHQDW